MLESFVNTYWFVWYFPSEGKLTIIVINHLCTHMVIDEEFKVCKIKFVHGLKSGSNGCQVVKSLE